MPYDLVIRHATLISGDGSALFEADLAVAGDRIAAIARGKIIAVGTLADLLGHEDPWLKEYFAGERGRTIFADQIMA